MYLNRLNSVLWRMHFAFTVDSSIINNNNKKVPSTHITPTPLVTIFSALKTKPFQKDWHGTNKRKKRRMKAAATAAAAATAERHTLYSNIRCCNTRNTSERQQEKGKKNVCVGCAWSMFITFYRKNNPKTECVYGVEIECEQIEYLW